MNKKVLDSGRIWLIIVILLVSTVGVAAVIDTYFIGSGVSMEQVDGPTVELIDPIEPNAEDPFPGDHRVDFGTPGWVESDGKTNVSISNIDSEYTNLSSLIVDDNTLIVNLENKQRIELNGDATSFEYRDMEVDDNTTDFTITGDSGSTLVTIYDLPDNTQIKAVNQSDGLADFNTTDDEGVLDLVIPHSTEEIELETTGPPRITDLDPTGNLSTVPDTLRAFIENPDHDNINTTVGFYWNGDHVDTVEAEQDGWVETSEDFTVTPGINTYKVEANDTLGGEHIREVDIGTPNQLFIRNETNPDELIDDVSVNVTLSWFDEDDEQVFRNESVTDGIVNMTGLPLSNFIVDVNADTDYFSRTIYVDSIIDQQDVYLLNESEDSIETRFTLEDVTGSFDETSILFISKAINQSGELKMRTIHADQFGVEGVTVDLERDERYNLRVELNGNIQDLGPYRSDTSETVIVRPGSPGVPIENYEAGWGSGVEVVEDDDGNHTLFVRYNDPDNLTNSVTVYIHERGNPDTLLRSNQTYFDLGNLDVQIPLEDGDEEKEWVVNFIIDRDGEEFTTFHYSNPRPDLIFTDLDDSYRQLFGIAFMFMFGGAFSILNRGAGAIMVGLVGGLLWWTGWLAGATTFASVAIFLFIAIVYNIYLSGGPPR